MAQPERLPAANGDNARDAAPTPASASYRQETLAGTDNEIVSDAVVPVAATGCLDHLEPVRASGWVALDGQDPTSIEVALKLGPLTIATGSPFIHREDVEMHLMSIGPHGFQLTWSIRDLQHLLATMSELPDDVLEMTIEATFEGSVWPLVSLVPMARPLAEWRRFFSAKFVDSAADDSPETPFFGAIEEIDGSEVAGWVVPKFNNTAPCVVSIWLDNVKIKEQLCELANRPDVAAVVERPWVYSFTLRPSLQHIAGAFSELLSHRRGEASGSATFSCRVGWSSSDGIGRSSDLCEFRIPARFNVTRPLSEWMEYFRLELNPSLLERRSPIYKEICSQISPTGAPDQYKANPELYLSSMVVQDPARAPSFRTSREALIEQYFDTAFYTAKYGDDPMVLADPIGHYLAIGAKSDYDPHPLFSSATFRRNLAVRHKAMPEDNDSFAHFLKHHAFMDADPHPTFSMEWYRRKYSMKNDRNPWVDYIKGGWNFGREPNWLFLKEIIEDTVCLSCDQISPLQEYLYSDACEQITPHPLFPSSWKRADYLRYFAGVASGKEFSTILFDRSSYSALSGNAKYLCKSVFADYFSDGELKGLSPNALFNPIWYRKTYHVNSDLKGPFSHYLMQGERLNYNPSPFFDTRLYKEKNNDVVLAQTGLSYHFLLRCHAEPARRACARFDSGWFASRAPTGVADMRSFLANKLLTPVEPHPAIIVSKRTPHADLVALLECEKDDSNLLPIGVSTVFNFSGTSLPTRGQVVSEIDAYEAELASIDAERATSLRLNEPITRMYELFDYANAERIHAETPAIPAPAPLVSVIIPGRNRAAVIGRAIRSALAQTYSNIEVIVVDDGSTDGTAVVAAGTGDKRVRIITLPPSGVSAARNAGLQIAKGEYIAYLDSDNTWERSYLNSVIGRMKIETLPTAHAALRIFGANGVIRYRGAPYDRESLDRENYIDMNVFVHHRRVVDEGLRFDETLLRCVDWDFIRRACLVVGPSTYIPIIGCNYLDDDKLGRITTDELQGDFFKLCLKQINLQQHITGLPRRRKPSFSLVWPVHRSEENSFLQAIWDAVRHMCRGRHELIVVANGLSDTATCQLDSMSRRIEGMRVIHLWRSFHFFPAAMLANKIVDSERLLLWSGEVQYNPNIIDRFMNFQREDQAAIEFPLVTDATGTVLPGYFTLSTDGADLLDVLSGKSAPKISECISSIGNREFPVSISRTCLDKLGGFNTDYAIRLGLVDLVVRSLAMDPKSVRLRMDCGMQGKRPSFDPSQEKVYARENEQFQRKVALPCGIAPALESAFFRIARPKRHVKVVDGVVRSEPARLPILSTRSRPGGLRIEIRCPAPKDETTNHWGDWHFANSLAEAFARHGQTPSVSLRTDWSKSSSGVDVALHIRGIVDIVPVPNALNIIWVISHPDKLRGEELQAADLVIATSRTLSDYLSKRFGVSSVVLPQATDAQRFAFIEAPSRPTMQDRLVFIGNSRRYPRRIVLDAMQIGAPVDVYGSDWEFYIPRGAIRGTFVANEEVANYYRSAAAVLNDHWPTMARHGIISNRIFDAIACGGVVISDEVAGLNELFSDHVRTCADAESLRALIQSLPDWAPSITARKEVSARVIEEHSFDARARQIAALAHDL